MKWSFRLGRFFGIDLYLHATFLLFLAWIWWTTRSHGPLTMGFFISAFTCVALHEYGHALMARRFGIRTEDITLLPIGGVARLERIPERPLHEFLVAIAGPAVNAAIAAALYTFCLIAKIDPALELSDRFTRPVELVVYLMWWNVIMILFNMLPAFPMDGGRVLRALLAMKLDYARATRAAALVGRGMAAIFVWVGLFGLEKPMPLLVIIAVFVWIGAGDEAAAAGQRSALAGVRARDAMLVDFRRVSPEDTAASVAQLTLQGWQTDFPVIFEERVVGIVTRQGVVSALSQDHAAPVRGFMREDVAFCDAGEPLQVVLERMRELSLPLMPVMLDGRLAGLVTPENTLEFIIFQQALKKQPA